MLKCRREGLTGWTVDGGRESVGVSDVGERERKSEGRGRFHTQVPAESFPYQHNILDLQRMRKVPGKNTATLHGESAATVFSGLVAI